MKMKTNDTLASTCDNVHDIAGGRKTTDNEATVDNIVAGKGGNGGGEGEEVAVLVSVGHDDLVAFSYEVESVPSLESESDDDEEEEEEEKKWESHEEEDAELGEGLAERLRILADARALKNLAVAFLHPERPVVVSDPTVFGRNYYGRPSAIEQKTDEDADEEVDILEDARALKMAAVAYLHPEIGISEVTPENFGRNYFNRPSAPETEEDEYADERAEILAEVTALKKLATDYMHPKLGVTAVDGTCFGRNYFNRPSAPETEDVEVAAERACVLAEAAALKKLAVDFMHPELSITFTDGTCFGRNYFNRPSAPETEDEDLAIEETHILADAAALKKQAADYMHPEVGVQTIDSTVFGRNFFNQEASALEKLAAAVKGANLPSTKSSSSDNDLGITKKSASSVNLFGLSEDFV